jgi:predicted ATPase with chaperone activity
VRSALIASGPALPARRITINLAPADLPKEGSHYDLPIALGLMAAIGAIPHDALSGFTATRERSLQARDRAHRGQRQADVRRHRHNEEASELQRGPLQAAYHHHDLGFLAQALGSKSRVPRSGEPSSENAHAG